MRLLLRILTPVLGLVIALAGLALAVETIADFVAPSSSPLVVPWRDWIPVLSSVSWRANAVRIVAFLVGIVGLVILLVGLASRRHDIYLQDPIPEVTVTTSPRSLARAVGHEVRSHDDVVSASVVASSSKVTVRAATLKAPDEAAPAVRAQVDTLLDRLPLARKPRVSVSMSMSRGVQ